MEEYLHPDQIAREGIMKIIPMGEREAISPLAPLATGGSERYVLLPSGAMRMPFPVWSPMLPDKVWTHELDDASVVLHHTFIVPIDPLN